MKLKNLLFTSLLALGGTIIYLTTTSSASGQMGVYTSGCGGTSCHGTFSAATTIELTSPTIILNKFDYGVTYPMTLKIKCTDTTMIKSGFDMLVSAGTITGNPSNTMVMTVAGGKEMHHWNTPFTMSGGVTTINFNWTAPTTAVASVTVNIAANAVNGNGNTSGDKWNLASLTFLPNAPSAVTDIDLSKFSIYPNPVTDNMTIKTTENITAINAVSLTGSVVNLVAKKMNTNEYYINTNQLNTGAYILLINDGQKLSHHKFIKN